MNLMCLDDITISFTQRRVQDFLKSGAELRAENFCPLENFSAPGAWQTREGTDYLIITKEGLVLASAPLPPIRAFFIRGRNILFFISSGAFLEGEGICLLCPTALHSSAFTSANSSAKVLISMKNKSFNSLKVRFKYHFINSC